MRILGDILLGNLSSVQFFIDFSMSQIASGSGSYCFFRGVHVQIFFQGFKAFANVIESVLKLVATGFRALGLFLRILNLRISVFGGDNKNRVFLFGGIFSGSSSEFGFMVIF